MNDPADRHKPVQAKRTAVPRGMGPPFLNPPPPENHDGRYGSGFTKNTYSEVRGGV